MGQLTEDAKAAIAEAIRIVREDRNEKWWREKVEASQPKPTDPPKNDPPVDPPKPTDPPTDPPVDPPKPTDPPTDPPKEPRKSAWWGELYDDED